MKHVRLTLTRLSRSWVGARPGETANRDLAEARQGAKFVSGTWISRAAGVCWKHSLALNGEPWSCYSRICHGDVLLSASPHIPAPSSRPLSPTPTEFPDTALSSLPAETTPLAVLPPVTADSSDTFAAPDQRPGKKDVQMCAKLGALLTTTHLHGDTFGSIIFEVRVSNCTRNNSPRQAKFFR